MSKQMKHLDLTLLNKTAVGNHVLHTRLGAPIETITEEKTARQRSPKIDGSPTRNEVTLDEDLFQKLNGQTTRRGMNMAMISTARRSPRYLGKYDNDGTIYDEDQEIKEQAAPTLLTQRRDTVTIYCNI